MQETPNIYSKIARRNPKNKDLTPIEFVHYVSKSGYMDEPTNTPDEFKEVHLLAQHAAPYNNLLDYIVAFDDFGNTYFYLGKWNDGVYFD